MIKVGDIYDYINIIAPFKNSMDFDNTGILIGNYENTVKNILISLDVTPEVCEEAIKNNFNLIITHHPVIFRPVKNIKFNTSVHKLLKYDINLISAHTNLDVAENGVNFNLCKKLDLKNLQALSYCDNINNNRKNNKIIMGFVGDLDFELSSRDFANFVKNKLNCAGLRYTNCNNNIKKVAVCAGAGGNLIQDVIKTGADAFVTGEIKHSDIILANSENITVVDAGHFRTENIIVPVLRDILKEKFSGINIEISQVFDDKMEYI